MLVIQCELGLCPPRDHLRYLRGIDNTEIIDSVH